MIALRQIMDSTMGARWILFFQWFLIASRHVRFGGASWLLSAWVACAKSVPVFHEWRWWPRDTWSDDHSSIVMCLCGQVMASGVCVTRVSNEIAMRIYVCSHHVVVIIRCNHKHTQKNVIEEYIISVICGGVRNLRTWAIVARIQEARRLVHDGSIGLW